MSQSGVLKNFWELISSDEEFHAPAQQIFRRELGNWASRKNMQSVTSKSSYQGHRESATQSCIGEAGGHWGTFCQIDSPQFWTDILAIPRPNDT